MDETSKERGSKKCECGCGKAVSPGSRFLRGHHCRKEPRYYEVDTGFASPCWIWALSLTPGGYGMERVPGSGPKVYAHRASYERHHGEIPEGLQIDHLCRERACINPDHLEPVTQQENVRRGNGTKLTEEAVKEIRGSSETQSNLANLYGVSQSQISRIKSGHCWR